MDNWGIGGKTVTERRKRSENLTDTFAKRQSMPQFVNAFGLNERQTKIITDILAKYPEVETAIIYASWAKGYYREGSDVDLTFKGEQLTYDIVKKIWGDLDDSSSPYLFDLSIYHQLSNPNFVEHIDRVGQIFYQRQG